MTQRITGNPNTKARRKRAGRLFNDISRRAASADHGLIGPAMARTMLARLARGYSVTDALDYAERQHS